MRRCDAKPASVDKLRRGRGFFCGDGSREPGLESLADSFIIKH